LVNRTGWCDSKSLLRELNGLIQELVEHHEHREEEGEGSVVSEPSGVPLASNEEGCDLGGCEN